MLGVQKPNKFGIVTALLNVTGAQPMKFVIVTGLLNVRDAKTKEI